MRYMLLMRIYDTWIERRTCDVCFILVHKGDLCRCECWTWIDVMIIWCHCELLSGDTWWKFNCPPYNCLPNVDKYWGRSNPEAGIPAIENEYMVETLTNQMNTWWGLSQFKWIHGRDSHKSNWIYGGESHKFLWIIRQVLPQFKMRNRLGLQQNYRAAISGEKDDVINGISIV